MRRLCVCGVFLSVCCGTCVVSLLHVIPQNIMNNYLFQTIHVYYYEKITSKMKIEGEYNILEHIIECDLYIMYT